MLIRRKRGVLVVAGSHRSWEQEVEVRLSLLGRPELSLIEVLLVFGASAPSIAMSRFRFRIHNA